MSVFDTVSMSADAQAALRKVLQVRITELQARLESVELSERETMAVRGGLQELRRLLSSRPPTIGSARVGRVNIEG